MVMTEYRLSRHTNGTLVVGYAYVGYACTRKGVSMVTNEGFGSATTIAHEFGHNIGMEHDSDGNNCTEGYIMDAVKGKDPLKKWKFSRCSADYARNYFKTLITHHDNCLNNIVDHHVDPGLLALNQRWYGTVFDHNEQCRIAFGKESNVCREVYSKPDVDPSDCGSLFCSLPNDTTCYAIEAGDGTTCGKNKWCMKDVCTASPHPINVTDLCFAGEVNYTIDNLTCEEIGRDHRAMCERNSVKMRCCYACANYGKLLTSPTDIDGQCQQKLTSASSFCRTASTYTNNSYQDIVCSKMYCQLPDDPDSCEYHRADDHTACGFKKWCVNGTCIHNEHAPAVPDDCPWGDDNISPFSVNGKPYMCKDVTLPINNYLCYTGFVAKRCCDTCNSLKSNKTGCEYGDTHPSCLNFFPTNGSFADTSMCYTDKNADICCASCAKYRIHAGGDCAWGDDNLSSFSLGGHTYMCKDVNLPINHHLCYSSFVAKRCCDTCNSLKSNLTGCEYGDTSASCMDYFPTNGSNPRASMCYTNKNADICCASCAKYRTNALGCEYGDRHSSCLNYFPTDGSSPRPSMCYTTNNADICCASCAKYRTNAVGCEYGDKLTGCQRAQCDRYTGNNLKGCCETCKDHAATIIG